ncbi:MAG: hypothetical protein G8D28_01705 [gamma proteobacterium symbiont of Phacoides pectinatus]
MKHLLALLLGLGVMSSPLSGVATSAPDVMPFAVRESQLDELHLRAVERARELARGRDVTLRILYPKGSELCVVATGKAFQELTGIRIEYVESTIDDINMEVQSTSVAGIGPLRHRAARHLRHSGPCGVRGDQPTG